jgi:CBS domain-containing protein
MATVKEIAKILMKYKHSPNFIENTKISTIAIKDIITAEPIADIRRVAKVMVTHHLNCIPIVSSENHEIVGIISRSDILTAVATNPHFQLWA